MCVGGKRKQRQETGQDNHVFRKHTSVMFSNVRIKELSVVTTRRYIYIYIYIYMCVCVLSLNTFQFLGQICTEVTGHGEYFPALYTAYVLKHSLR